MSGQVPVNAAKQNSPRAAASISTARPFNTAAPKLKVNDALPKTYSYFKAHSPVRRAFNKKSVAKTNNLNEKVKTARVNNVTTVGPKAVVSTAKGNGENAVKSSTCWIWRPTGNVIDHTSKDSRSYMLKRFNYVDLQGRLNGCSRHMTGNKSFLTDYQEIDGRFVAFGGSPKGGQAGQEKASDHEYILLPLMLSNSPLSLSSKSTYNKDADENVQDFRVELDNLLVQQKEGYANSTNRYSTVSPSVSTAGNFFTNTNDLPTDPLIPDLEDTGIFSGAYDDEDVGVDADLNNYPSWIEAMQEELLQFKLQKMDVKSAFLYGTIEEEVYVCQPPGFEDPQFPGKVYKVEKALYGLHQAPRAWYETLSTYLLENRFRRGTIDKTLFIKKDKGDILLVQVYVDDIIFGSTKNSLCVEFEQMMHKKFQMSSMGELTFFLGLQVMQKDDGIFISQDKYVADILKKFDFVTCKKTRRPIETNKALLKDEEAEDVDVHLYRSMIGSLMYLTASRPDIMFAVCACARFQVTPKVSHLNVVKRIFRYLKGQPKLGLWYPRDSPFDLEAFSDSDYAGASLDRKSTIGAEYVAASNCCGQVLWIQNQMLDYGFNFMNTKIHIDNESTICIVKNLVFHSKTKHIEIRHHFIRDSYEKKLIQVIKIHTDHNVADLLTKAFDVSRKAKRTTKISQSSGPIHLVADETVYKEWEDRMERAATTASSLEAKQDSGNINRTQSMATLNESFPQGTDLGSGPRCQDTILGGAEA
ncbi:putative ribonuclease H-like domain-containing protein [Tanacetum coccineum]